MDGCEQIDVVLFRNNFERYRKIFTSHPHLKSYLKKKPEVLKRSSDDIVIRDNTTQRQTEVV